MRIELDGVTQKHPNLFPNKFLPILPNYDPLHLLSTTTPISTTPNKLFENHKDKDRPHLIHQFAFVSHNKPSNIHFHAPKPQRPKPPAQYFPVEYHHVTEEPIKLFIPAVAATYLPPIRGGHRRPNSLDSFNDTWDIKFNLTDELRELLKLEKNKLEAISLALNSKTKWPVTNSRSKHRDDFVFVARANNPFGHSTKWKIG